MTLREATEKHLEVFFLPTALEAEAFAGHLHKHTGRETGFFTETVAHFPLHVATLVPRPGVIKFTRAGGSHE